MTRPPMIATRSISSDFAILLGMSCFTLYIAYARHIAGVEMTDANTRTRKSLVSNSLVLVFHELTYRFGMRQGKHNMPALLQFCFLLCLLGPAYSHTQPIPRPDHTDHARLARWLVCYNGWGTLSTQGWCQVGGGGWGAFWIQEWRAEDSLHKQRQDASTDINLGCCRTGWPCSRRGVFC